MTDTSSDEENNLRIFQALDKQFINDNLFSRTLNKSGLDASKTHTTSLLPSLRYKDSNDHDISNALGLNVTPEFQKHVARHLSIMLDRQLKEVKPTLTKLKKKHRKEKGLRLLSSSSTCLCSKDAEDFTAAHNANRKLREKTIDSEEENKKILEAAVSSEWLLSGEATKGWVKSTKGEVIQGTHRNNKVSSKKKKKAMKSLKKEVKLSDN